jgi:hypothetical protein
MHRPRRRYSPSPDRALLILLERPGLPSIAEISAPEYRLAGFG